MTPTYETLFVMCIRKHVCVCCFGVMYDINFVRYETTLQVRMQVCWNSNLKISNSKNGEIIRHKINPKVLSKNEIGWIHLTGRRLLRRAGICWTLYLRRFPEHLGYILFFAQNIDKSCGAVVCDQKFLADYFGVSLRTIQYWLRFRKYWCHRENTSRYLLCLCVRSVSGMARI